ncbi:hypothetical protein F5Y13DRAFT_192576 [Hypoxylon sp. FL1857]|nr:hypothetical protein F5Y13DRAFT_192576 [Hypoxylon sp. FL1857]
MAVITGSHSTPAVKACGIVYIVVLVAILIIGTILYARITYFKSHPLRSPPVDSYVRPGADDDDRGNDDDRHNYRKSTGAGDLEDPEQTSGFEDVELGDIGEQRPQVSRPSYEVQYDWQYSQNPYRNAAEMIPDYLQHDRSVIAKADGLPIGIAT